MKRIFAVLLFTSSFNVYAGDIDGKAVSCESIETEPVPDIYVFKKGKVRFWGLTQKKSGAWKRKRRYKAKYSQSDYYTRWTIDGANNYLDRKTLQLGEHPQAMEQQCSVLSAEEAFQRLDALAHDLNAKRD